MSQEINLLNPSLLPRRDWLGFEGVAVAVAASLCIVGGLYAWAGARSDTAQQQLATTSTQLKNLQQELQAMQAQLAARKNDPALDREVQRLGFMVRQSRELLRFAEGSSSQGGGDVAAVMRGFSRQITDGVWLTGFTVGPAGFEIRGRLLDPSLLPAYIRKLNAEPAFRGRRFAALDMHAGAYESPARGNTAGGNTAVSAGGRTAVQTTSAPFTEFALQASPAALPSSPSGQGVR